MEKVRMLSTPILFVVFNRPDTTLQVLKQIAAVQPQKLYVAADGPRPHKPSEKEICNKVRELVMSGITWQCEVKTLFRSSNLGCKEAVSSAITWFFEHEEEGIILEDDCLPSLSFFRYCKYMLEKYRQDTNILSVNGCNFGFHQAEKKYFFSPFMNMWGWATWRRSSSLINYEMTSWKKLGFIGQLYYLSKIIPKNDKGLDIPWIRYWWLQFRVVANNELDTWDYQWLWHCFLYRKYCIVPPVNLVSNLGFNAQSTHTHAPNSLVANMEKYELDFPISGVAEYTLDNDYEEIFVKKYWACYQRRPFYLYPWLIVKFFLRKVKRSLDKKTCHKC
jgi:hypothetical protein